MNPRVFSRFERAMAFFAGTFNFAVGLGFFLLPELHLPLWPQGIPAILTRFIGAIILGNSIGAFWLASEHEWARVRPLALVAVVYGTLVAVALLYHLLALGAPALFWLYFAFDLPFLLVFYGLFLYHDLLPLRQRRNAASSSPNAYRAGR